MGPVRRNSASSSSVGSTSKPYVKTSSERLRGSTSATAHAPCDSDEDVQILEDLGLPGSRKGKKTGGPGQGPSVSERESKPQRPVSPGSSDTNRPKPESKGKGKNLFNSMTFAIAICGGHLVAKNSRFANWSPCNHFVNFALQV